mgnify:CR=1 FL=1
MSSNYQEEGIDLDYIYIGANDVNYFPIETLNITRRKVVSFGQNALTNVYPISNLGTSFNLVPSNIPKVDLDNVSIHYRLELSILI